MAVMIYKCTIGIEGYRVQMLIFLRLDCKLRRLYDFRYKVR